MKKLAALILALIMALSVFSALAELSPAQVVGAWYLQARTHFGIDYIMAGDYRLELNRDKTALLVMDGVERIYNWDILGDFLTLTAPEGSAYTGMTVTYDGESDQMFIALEYDFSLENSSLYSFTFGREPVAVTLPAWENEARSEEDFFGVYTLALVYYPDLNAYTVEEEGSCYVTVSFAEATIELTGLATKTVMTDYQDGKLLLDASAVAGRQYANLSAALSVDDGIAEVIVADADGEALYRLYLNKLDGDRPAQDEQAELLVNELQEEEELSRAAEEQSKADSDASDMLSELLGMLSSGDSADAGEANADDSSDALSGLLGMLSSGDSADAGEATTDDSSDALSDLLGMLSSGDSADASEANTDDSSDALSDLLGMLSSGDSADAGEATTDDSSDLLSGLLDMLSSGDSADAREADGDGAAVSEDVFFGEYDMMSTYDVAHDYTINWDPGTATATVSQGKINFVYGDLTGELETEFVDGTLVFSASDILGEEYENLVVETTDDENVMKLILLSGEGDTMYEILFQRVQ